MAFIGKLTRRGKLNRVYKSYEFLSYWKFTNAQLYELVEQFIQRIEEDGKCQAIENVWRTTSKTLTELTISAGEWSGKGQPGWFMYQFSNEAAADAFIAYRNTRKRHETIDEILQDLENE